ncbi:MAG: hypothetical protein HY674_12630 [Chloroflexi bacterium]|nr:hypothetical protein [Chloroflexota bacterium]
MNPNLSLLTISVVVRREESAPLERAPGPAPAGHPRYRLPAGQCTALTLKLT